MKQTLIEAAVISLMVVMLALAVARADTGDLRSAADHACTSSESWNFGPAISTERRQDFRSFLDQKMKPAQGFAEGLAQRSIAQTDEARIFGEYWVSRALYEARLVHLAFDGFSLIASRPVTPDTAGVQLAALDCVMQITGRYPSIAVPAPVLARVPDFKDQASTTAEHQAVWEAAGAGLRQDLADGHPDRKTLEQDLALVEGAGAYESLARGLAAASRRDHQNAITELDRFLNAPSLPARLSRFVDPARILLARSLYTMQQFDRSAAQLRQVSKASNELADTLSELSWAFLMNERYPEAIGTAMSLHAGGLRRTFTPEAGMVMAMALNELCQYPESVNAINVLRKSYDRAYRWLSQWDAARKSSTKQSSLYALAVDFVKKKPVAVPEKIAGEWVRSPLVLASQEEIDLIFDEADAAATLGRSGIEAQRREAERIIHLARELRPKLDDARKFRKPGEALPSMILAQVAVLKRELAHFKRLQHAAPIWRAVLANSQRKMPAIEKGLVARINSDLERRSERMLAQLDEIAENVQMIEIEIYNGASQDIIWQNAHPDYHDLAERMKSNGDSPDKVWDWGRAPAYDSDDVADTAEIWEDELGSFKADLFDNCSSKDKYLALKMRHKH